MHGALRGFREFLLKRPLGEGGGRLPPSCYDRK